MPMPLHGFKIHVISVAIDSNRAKDWDAYLMGQQRKAHIRVSLEHLAIVGIPPTASVCTRVTYISMGQFTFPAL